MKILSLLTVAILLTISTSTYAERVEFNIPKKYMLVSAHRGMESLTVDIPENVKTCRLTFLVKSPKDQELIFSVTCGGKYLLKNVYGKLYSSANHQESLFDTIVEKITAVGFTPNCETNYLVIDKVGINPTNHYRNCLFIRSIPVQ